MATRFHQANLNRSRGAQDLFTKALCESGSGLGIAAELYSVAGSHPSIGVGVCRGRVRALYVVGVCAPPSWDLARFEHLLDQLGDLTTRRPQKPVLVAGDLKAKSALWGSSVRCRRGEVMQEWVMSHGICVVNKGRRSTFVVPQGRYIMVQLVATPEEMLQRRSLRGARPRRWTLAKLDRDKLVATLLAATWAEPDPAPGTRPAIKDEVEIAEPRRSACQARRIVGQQGKDDEGRLVAEEAYREKREALKAAIAAAKARTWDDLVSTINRDPWGRPYHIMMRRFRSWAPPPTMSLDPGILDEVVRALFPWGKFAFPPTRVPLQTERKEVGITKVEMDKAVRKLGAKKRALALKKEGVKSRIIWFSCLRTGVFLCPWKRANLVLFRKGGKAEDSPFAYRPICLLDEAGKLFERIIHARLVRHLPRDSPTLNEEQYGFREGRSSVDVILRVWSLSEAVVEAGLAHFRVAPHLVSIIRDYFRDKRLEFRNNAELQCGRAVYRGVPQESVLGPLLWSIAGWRNSLEMGRLAVDQVVSSLSRMGLKVASFKSELMFIHDGSRGEPPRARVRTDDISVKMGPTIKYLGLLLDGVAVRTMTQEPGSRLQDSGYQVSTPFANQRGFRDIALANPIIRPVVALDPLRSRQSRLPILMSVACRIAGSASLY
ncbi:uncharacterized protein LOC116840891 [Odontomachus brunneus]|uniref:uncharacterized protein LOC116840891 n=1 Tax=Odontomachus brunneus TaxID=486640 RepID=UPI0013F24D3E|nr:uncharacterized protein LOC116840891 [Odontomachus brunneus]